MGVRKTLHSMRCPMGPGKPIAAGAILLSALSGPVANVAAQDILTHRSAHRQQMILDGARKEGQVVIYSAMIVNQAMRPLSQAFMKKYPFIKMSFWRGD